MKLYDRYKSCYELVASLPIEKQQGIQGSLSKLLHLEQARDKAEKCFNEYKREMNEWEDNIVKHIEDYVREEAVSDGTDGDT